MNATIAQLTASTLLGKRRVLLLFILPALVLALAVVVRLAAGVDSPVGPPLLQSFALGTIVPLLGLIAGTGVIGPEIDEGSIVYILAKPIGRPVIIVTKLAVAAGCLIAFAAVPIFVAGLIMSGFDDGLAVGFGVGAAVAGVAYSALFLLLAVLTRHAVVFGLVYALIWETFVGGFVPGARTLSIQQWSLSVADKLISRDAIDAAVGTGTGVLLLVLVSVAATWLAGQRLRSLTLTDAE
jgi:ABC-2 type transport system permease protein